jgi:hypothetical protein
MKIYGIDNCSSCWHWIGRPGIGRGSSTSGICTRINNTSTIASVGSAHATASVLNTAHTFHCSLHTPRRP